MWKIARHLRHGVAPAHPAHQTLEGNPDNITRQVIGIVEHEFASNPGRAADICLPVDRAGALEWLDLFIRERLPRFGIYEDMMAEGELFLFHSVLRDAESWIAQST